MIFISPPFGNYISLPYCKSIKGSYTNDSRPGLIKQIYNTLYFDYVLDGYDVVLNHFNIFNRLQESIYRQGMFAASLIRQLDGKGIDYDQLLSAEGMKRLGNSLSPDVIAKAVDDALEFTYAARPKTKMGQQINDFMVNN